MPLPLCLALGLALAGGSSAGAQQACGLFEAVEPGDTLATISERCDVPVETLQAANPGVDAASPEVATRLSLVLPGDDEVAGAAEAPGPRVVQAPAAEAEPAAQVVVVATEPAPGGGDDIDGRVLQPVFGQWVPSGGVCADPEVVWTIEDERLSVGTDICAIENTVLTAEAYVLETICGGNGVVVARDFTLQPRDALTLGFATGGQQGVLERCVPD